MPGVHEESVFESAIARHLLDHGYHAEGGYDAGLGLDLGHLFAFFQASQPDEWLKLSRLHGSGFELKVVKRLAQELASKGSLRVLREGITDHGVHLRLAFFRPATSLGPDLVRRYEANRVSVLRQVPLLGGGSVDLSVFVNGIPVATVELKDQQTGQTYRNAVEQYRKRNPKDPLFAYPTRSLVHFAVDEDEAWMTTRLQGGSTRFLPFNRGRDGGAGNPDNPGGYKTAYLWEEVLQRDSLLDLVQRFVTVEYPPGKKGLTDGRVVFPRYHQWDVVCRLEADARASGSGRNYLVMHSTGSGKSLSIAWTAHRLHSLHDAHDERVFHSVVVVTDRVVLDQQLQTTVYSIEHKHGVVQRIDVDSKQLAEALEAGTPIIITTLQKFPFVIDRVGKLPARRYAVIVDEAHSSQTGEAARKLREVLAVGDLAEAEKADAEGEEYDPEEEILKVLAAAGRQPNLSFFAFTATPKAKTLEMFGTDRGDGKPRPFHTYSMRQAIEEGFIMDVLGNYTTYQRYYQLSKQIAEDPQFESRVARKAIAEFVELHPHNIAQKVAVIVEHFRQNVADKIGGQAKAMAVTGSRLHAVRYYLAIRKYLAEHPDDGDPGVLVAFSGTVRDGAADFTEPGLNGFGEKELPEQFDGPKYRLLVVAEKYQTGFDQPKLHTMYVDKKLHGLHAVQTLSRLNRTHPAKQDTFILDFVNSPEEIIDAYAPYYREAVLESRTDPNLLYTLKDALDDFGVYWPGEVEEFARLFFKPSHLREPGDQGKLNSIVDLAVARYKAEQDEEGQETFRRSLGQFLRLYAFLAYVITFQDPALEKLYSYGRWLHRKLPAPDTPVVNLDDEVALAAYRLDKTGTVAIDMEEQETREIPPTTGVSGQVAEETYVRLSELIQKINELFGLNLTPADALFFEQVGQDMLADDTLGEQAKQNSRDNFRIVFNEAFLQAVLGRKDRNDDILALVLDKPEIAEAIRAQMLDWVYHGLQERKSISELITAGENATVEFKASARWNQKAGRETPEIADAVVKTVAAFLNTEGGTLLIGVGDDGAVVGLAEDIGRLQRKDLDGFQNWLMASLLPDRLGKPAVTHVRCGFGHLDGGDICRLDVTPSPKPVFAKTSKADESFFVRVGNATQELGKQDMLDYIADHWRIGSSSRDD